MAGNALPLIALAAGAFLLLGRKGGSGGPSLTLPLGTLTRIADPAHAAQIGEMTSNVVAFIGSSPRPFDQKVLTAFSLAAPRVPTLPFVDIPKSLAPSLSPHLREALKVMPDADLNAFFVRVGSKIDFIYLFDPATASADVLAGIQPLVHNPVSRNQGGVTVKFSAFPETGDTTAAMIADALVAALQHSTSSDAPTVIFSGTRMGVYGPEPFQILRSPSGIYVARAQMRSGTWVHFKSATSTPDGDHSSWEAVRSTIMDVFEPGELAPQLPVNEPMV